MDKETKKYILGRVEENLQILDKLQGSYLENCEASTLREVKELITLWDSISGKDSTMLIERIDRELESKDG